MGKYRSFATHGGQTTLDLTSAMVAAIAAREAELRKATDSNEVFCKMDSTGKQATIYAKALNEYRVVGKFSMEQLPGCCGVAVSYHSQIETQFRRRGIGRLFLSIREDAAKRSNYTVVLATVRVDNEAESQLLATSGYQRSLPFR